MILFFATKRKGTLFGMECQSQCINNLNQEFFRRPIAFDLDSVLKIKLLILQIRITLIRKVIKNARLFRIFWDLT